MISAPPEQRFNSGGFECAAKPPHAEALPWLCGEAACCPPVDYSFPSGRNDPAGPVRADFSPGEACRRFKPPAIARLSRHDRPARRDDPIPRRRFRRTFAACDIGQKAYGHCVFGGPRHGRKQQCQDDGACFHVLVIIVHLQAG